ncbi:hypothetical protein BC829DRAFT_416761 [Chytridium lagenaria]|nr:hypothetical protein BC829DRAFT_416761 [Chytridium lagenaria]
MTSLTRSIAEHLSAVVQLDTVSYDDQSEKKDIPSGPGFLQLHDYVKKTYPLVHANLKRHVINKYSLLYVWEGTEKSEAPLMLCAHMDTVPVLNETIDQWSHEPWSGLIADGFIWGRGSSDTKNTMIAILEAGEALLKGGYKPRRTVFFAFGHDEEVSGNQGAGHISNFMVNELGLTKKVGLIVDEGTPFRELYGTEYALVSIAEKGYYNAEVTVRTGGGHSSLPPDHTAIGILSESIVTLEKNPHPLTLIDSSPMLQTLQCLSHHSTNMGFSQKFAINRVWLFKSLVLAAMRSQREMKYLMTTSQAVDIVKGGHKVNALPEVATTVINHRIAFDSSSSAIENRIFNLLKPVASKNALNITLVPANTTSLPVTISANNAIGSMEIKTFGHPLEPSPVSPTFGHPVWEVLAGTIKHALAPKNPKKSFAVTPLLMPANTDTKKYWVLSDNIYRFGPFRYGEGIHTVDEKLPYDSLIEGVRFFHELIRNYDEM